MVQELAKTIKQGTFMNSIQVLLIDPHQLSREGLRLVLAGESCDVVGATRSVDEAHAAIKQGLHPDLILLVLGHLGESQHAATLQQIRAGFSDFKFVIIATDISPTLLAQCVGAGVNACLLGDMSASVLTQSLRLIMLGQQIFPTPAAVLREDAANHASREFGEIAAQPGLSRSLSGREGEILCNLLHGYSNKMIARELNISEATVKVHLKALLRKLKARNRTQAAIWAMENGYAERSVGVPPPLSGSAA
jgi:two-component system, NarL family, nitrate/nitrite response regulator NarL